MTKDAYRFNEQEYPQVVSFTEKILMPGIESGLISRPEQIVALASMFGTEKEIGKEDFSLGLVFQLLMSRSSLSRYSMQRLFIDQSLDLLEELDGVEEV